MNNKQDLGKKLRVFLIILGAIIFPGIIKLFGSSAYESVRTVDIVLLFTSGVAVGVFIVTLKLYLQTSGDK